MMLEVKLFSLPDTARLFDISIEWNAHKLNECYLHTALFKWNGSMQIVKITIALITQDKSPEF